MADELESLPCAVQALSHRGNACRTAYTLPTVMLEKSLSDRIMHSYGKVALQIIIYEQCSQEDKKTAKGWQSTKNTVRKEALKAG